MKESPVTDKIIIKDNNYSKNKIIMYITPIY